MSITAMKQALDFLRSGNFVYPTKIATDLDQAIAEAEKQKPIARVTGVYGGRFIVEPLNPAMVLPTNMALFDEPQPKTQAERAAWVGLTDEELMQCVVHARFEYDPPYTDKNGVTHLAHYAVQVGATYKNIEAKLKEKNA